ncbi:MAG TPA: exo-alpha-sialidase [Planctomycetota bacterium]|nr:exo-alpha-sialidase [Planctomycetota bacterium]
MHRRCPPLARSAALALLAAVALAQEAQAVDTRDRDPRNIRTGHPIPVEGYCDQPYVVVNRDGSWLCTLTTAGGHEGARGEHMVATRSTDQGKTWSPLVDIEPADGPSSSYGSPIVTPGGRVYCVYCYNGDKLSTLPDGKPLPRADMLGWFVLKWSDDGGRTWSRERHRLPMRVTACDRANDWKGAVQIFWSIDKPKAVGADLLFAFTKLGKYMLDDGEGWVYRSDNLLAEPDPAKLRWELLPEGDHGIRAPQFGSVQEEHNLVPLADGRSLYCVYRTTTGHPCHAYSRDGGRTWTTPEHMTCSPGGRKMKTPRACPKLWKTSNGKYLFWFHNHSGKGFEDRNPAWIAGGGEKDGFLHWSQPEILLYDPEPRMRMSYPDLIEQDGRFWVTETQKTLARIHEINPTLLEGLWRQGEAKEVARRGLVLDLGREQLQTGSTALPRPIPAAETGGLSLDLWVALDSLAAGQVLLQGEGLALATAEKGSVRIEMANGKTRFAWDCDPGLLRPGRPHHLVAIVDAGPRIISFVVDGVLCDGGEARQFGWARYPDALAPVCPAALRIGPAIHRLRVYDRFLRTSEAIASFHAGSGGTAR